jgi:transposase
MARIEVEYTVKMKQVIDWPDDELDNFCYESLECNLDIEDSSMLEIEDITEIKKNGLEHDF